MTENRQRIEVETEHWPCGCVVEELSGGHRSMTRRCENHILLEIADLLQQIVKRREEVEDAT